MNPDGVLTAVDPFPAGRLGFSLQQRIAHAEVEGVGNGCVAWVRKTGADAARGHSPVDFVFIDGDHSEPGLLADWNAWSPLVASGGIVALHDSRSSNDRLIDDAGSVKVTNEVILPDRRFELIDAVDTLTVLRREPAK
jgi:predicted O-methyltransferase YrrM